MAEGAEFYEGPIGTRINGHLVTPQGEPAEASPLDLLTPPEPEVEDPRIKDLEKQLLKTQRDLYEAKRKQENLVRVTQEAARDACLAQGRFEPTPAPTLDHHALAHEVALWDTGDWQYSKVTPSYNSDVADERVRRFVDRATLLTQERRKSRTITHGVILFGGDMVEGLFNYPTQPYEIDAHLFEQYVRVARLCVDVVKSALQVFDTVQVSAEWGNHGRIGSKRDAVVRSDNVDRMCFELARQLLGNEERLTWPESPEDVQRIEVGNYRALNMHGDEFGRTGFVAPATFVQHVNRWASGAYRVDGQPWKFRDVYSHHNHQFGELPLANGEGTVFWNGSTESDNRYAQMSLASQALPSQRVHFIDPNAGRVTGQHKVWLDV